MFDKALNLVVAESFELIEYTEPRAAQQLLARRFMIRTATAFPAGRREVVRLAQEMVELPAFELLWPILLHEHQVEKLNRDNYFNAKRALRDQLSAILASSDSIS